MPIEVLPAKEAGGWRQPGAATVVPRYRNRVPSFDAPLHRPQRSERLPGSHRSRAAAMEKKPPAFPIGNRPRRCGRSTLATTFRHSLTGGLSRNAVQIRQISISAMNAKATTKGSTQAVRALATSRPLRAFLISKPTGSSRFAESQGSMMLRAIRPFRRSPQSAQPTQPPNSALSATLFRAANSQCP